jgi:phage-related protein (TIGR01555 family)
MAKRGNPNMKPGAPSVNPTGKPKQARRDGWTNSASGHGTTYDRRMLTRFGVDVVTDLEARQLWRSEWLCRRIIEVIPGEANRRGWDLRVDDQKLAAAIEARAEELDLDGAMTRAAEYERAYGGAAIFPVLSGALGDLSQPLDDTKIAKVEAIHVLEPQELVPETFYGSLAHPKFGQPETYRLHPLSSGRTGYVAIQTIHESRLIIFGGKRVSRQAQPGQRVGWGDSELNHARQMISDAGLTWGSVATLLHEFGQGVYAIAGLGEMMSRVDGPAELARRMDAMDMFKSSMRATAIDAEDSYTRMSTPATGLSDLLVQQFQWIAAVADMPVTVLFGMSPAGLNATGDMDVRNWYAKVEKADATNYAPKRERLIRMLLLEGGREEPDLWSVEARPLWSPSDKEVADARLVDATADEKWVAMGACSPDDIAESHWAGDKYTRDIKIDWARRKKEQAEADKIAEEMRAAEAEALANPEPVEGDKPGDPEVAEEPVE